MNSWQLVILQTGRTMARMTEIGFPRKFGTGPKGLGSKTVGVICEKQGQVLGTPNNGAEMKHKKRTPGRSFPLD
jgi:hypothetical protein